MEACEENVEVPEERRGPGGRVEREMEKRGQEIDDPQLHNKTG